MAFQDKLKFLRENKQLSMDELAQKLNERYNLTLNKSTISRWEKGAEPKGKDVHYLAHFFGISPSYLIDLDLEGKVDDQESNSDSISLQLYGSVAAGALATIDGVAEGDAERIVISKSIIGKYATLSDLFAMRVNGDSMNRIIKDGEIVIAKRLELHEYKDGDIVIFSHNGEYSLKRFAPNEIEGFILFKTESDNQEFKDIAIPKDTCCDLKIYGKVIFCGSTF